MGAARGAGARMDLSDRLAVMLALPIGANRGPVSLLVNSVLPFAVILLLRGKAVRNQFGTPRSVTG